MFKRVLTVLLLGVALGCSSVWASIGAAEAMNLSGMQRMLSQRIAKSYLMIGAEVRSEVAVKQLDQSLASFESNLQALRAYAPTEEIRVALETAGQTWQRYREQVLMAPDKAKAVQVLALSDQLLAESEAVVGLLERHLNTPASALVNRSGRQRMLSQRIATLYLALSWRLPVQDLEESFAQAVTEFDASLAALQGARQNTPAIAQTLEQASAQWRFSQAGFRLSADSQFVPTVIATTTEALLQQMVELTAQYEEMMRSGS